MLLLIQIVPAATCLFAILLQFLISFHSKCSYIAIVNFGWFRFRTSDLNKYSFFCWFFFFQLISMSLIGPKKCYSSFWSFIIFSVFLKHAFFSLSSSFSLPLSFSLFFFFQFFLFFAIALSLLLEKKTAE